MLRSGSSLIATCRRIAAPALWGLRTYPGTGLLVVGTAAVALTAVLPVMSLSSRLGLPAWRGGDLGMAWSTLAWSPTVTRSVGLALLARLALNVAAGVLAVAGLTMLSLSVARASARTTEASVRRAVGASRRQLFASALLESGILALGALLLGGIAGTVVTRAATTAWPGTLHVATASMTGLAALGVVAAILVGGVMPIALPRRTSPLPPAAGRPLPLVVPALQLGLSLTILAAAALLRERADPLIGPVRDTSIRGEVLQLNVSDGRASARAQQYGSLLQNFRSRPGVRAVSLSSPGTLMGLGMVDLVITDCGRCAQGGLPLPLHPVVATHHFVSADTFRVLGLAVLGGRGITPADRWNAPRVAIVNQSLAARHFERGQAVGRTIAVGADRANWYRVVGVVEDQQAIGFGAGVQPPFAVYLAVLQHPVPSVDLLVEGVMHDGPTPVTTRRVVRTSPTELMNAEIAPLQWFARLFRAEGWAILAVATVGMGAVMQLWVRSLWYELGVRKAAGARRGDILGFVLLRASGVVAGGVAIGLWFGLLVWGTLSTVVAGLPDWDLSAALRIAPLLAGAALAGALPAAWQAARARPTQLLAALD